MFGAFRSVRSDERRDTWSAFITLFGLIASHSVLETARDALFLSKIPPERLPWVYMGIAALSLLVTRLGGGALGRRGVLASAVVASAAITGGMYAALPILGDAGLYALYVWSGVLTTIILVRYWTLVGAIFTVTQAKRVYSVIGAGSVLGAIAGSAAARALAEVVPAEKLLLAAALGLLATAVASLTLRNPEATSDIPERVKDTLVESAVYVGRQPYARQIGLLVLTSAACLTLADYVFKSTVAAEIPADELGSFFATVYLVLNVLSFTAQLGLVGWVLRRFDLSVALAVLPVLLLVGGVGMVAAAGVVAALAIKGADGALRYSLHRTASELLFVPLTDRSRGRVKAFIDVVAQKGGQALASVAILAAVALGGGVVAVSVALVVLAALWVACAVGIRRPYLDLFRSRLLRTNVELLEKFPELDVGSLESLVAALDSQDDEEVMVALDLLERERKTRVVPGLILHHPSAAVVEHALALFARTGRTNVVPIAGRLLTHRDPRVRSAAIAARSVLAWDEELLRSFVRTEASEMVRATATIQLIAGGAMDAAEAKSALGRIVTGGSSAEKRGLIDAIALRRVAGFEDELVALGSDPDQDIRAAAVAAMAAVPHEGHLPVLVDALGDEATRPAARQALVARGEPALRYLAEAFTDESRPRVVRWQLPKTIGRFAVELAAPVLLSRLPDENDGLVRFRTIRALEALVREHPGLALDKRVLGQVIEDTLGRAYRYLDRRLALARGAQADESRRTPGHELLVALIADKERHAVGRLFRLLGLAHRGEDFVRIHRGLASEDRRVRATSVELVENVLRPPLRGGVLGLIDDVPDEERRSAGSPWHPPRRHDYAGVLTELLGSSSDAIRDLTLYHVGELALASLRPRIEEMDAASLATPDARRTLAILEAASTPAGDLDARR
jgi:AAA family ATP:ADP antiporter